MELCDLGIQYIILFPDKLEFIFVIGFGILMAHHCD